MKAELISENIYEIFIEEEMQTPSGDTVLVKKSIGKFNKIALERNRDFLNDKISDLDKKLEAINTCN